MRMVTGVVIKRRTMSMGILLFLRLLLSYNANLCIVYSINFTVIISDLNQFLQPKKYEKLPVIPGNFPSLDSGKT